MTMSGPPGNRGEDGHLVGVADGRRQLDWFTVEPYPAAGRDRSKLLAVTGCCRRQNLTYRGRNHLVVPGAGGLPGRREKAQDRHQQGGWTGDRRIIADSARRWSDWSERQLGMG
jgi:hypothetical protein